MQSETSVHTRTSGCKAQGSRTLGVFISWCLSRKTNGQANAGAARMDDIKKKTPFVTSRVRMRVDALPKSKQRTESMVCLLPCEVSVTC